MRDTIDLAREAGDDWDSTLSTDKEFLKRLVALARADEREACAKVCKAIGQHNIIDQCAAAIRARRKA